MEQPAGHRQRPVMSSTAKWGEIIFWVLVTYFASLESVAFLSRGTSPKGPDLSLVQICRIVFTLLLFFGIHAGKELPVKLLTLFILFSGAVSVINGLGYYGSSSKVNPLLIAFGGLNIVLGLALATPPFTAYVKHRAMITDRSMRDPSPTSAENPFPDQTDVGKTS